MCRKGTWSGAVVDEQIIMQMYKFMYVYKRIRAPVRRSIKDCIFSSADEIHLGLFET